MNTPSASVYTDFQGLASLKGKAQKDSAGSLDEVARQFESLFVQMMVKSMRQASLGEGALDSDQSLFYRDMYDQQLSLHLANSGGLGLTEVIKRQLGGETGAPETKGIDLDGYRHRPVPMAKPLASVAPPKAGRIDEPEPASPEEFVRQLWPLAQEAAAKLGQEPHALIAQAALETGWGRHMIRRPDGSSSHNLFNIKADHRWDGERASVDTLEYEQGAAVKKKANFRAYGSYRDSFNDYVEFLRSSPRYQGALDETQGGGYFAELQKAGYATDPNYAEKISSVMSGREMTQALAQLKKAGVTPL
jgi:flagellar protein FlgJ